MSDSLVDLIMRLMSEPRKPAQPRPRSPSKRVRYISYQPTVEPEQVAAFEELAALQRAKPERAMEAVQALAGGGTLDYLVEHVGDLTHRMSELTSSGWTGYGIVKDKVECALRDLNRSDFLEDVWRRVRDEAKHSGVTPKDQIAAVEAALAHYAAAHAALPIHNRAQWLAREAAISLGRQDWARARRCLEALQAILADEDLWAFASRLWARRGRR